MSSSVLTLSTYRPKVQDPRVRARIEKVLDWAMPHLMAGKPVQVSAKALTAVFGNQTSNDLSKWLREEILARTGRYRPGVHPFSYTIISAGYEKLLQMMAEP